MNNPLFNALVKMAGLPKVPTSPQELFSMISGNPQFQKDLQLAEEQGILKRDSQGNLKVLDQDKLNSAVQNFFANMLSGNK